MDTSKTFWLPRAASTFAPSVDWAFNLYLWISIFFFTVIVALIVVFVFKYLRRHPDQQAQGQMTHNTALETIWTVVPLLIVIGLFIIGMKGFWNMRVAPSNSMTVDVTGRQWSWSFSYPEQGVSSDTLVVPVHQPVRLKLTSVDVIHSFFIPAFRTKSDVVPGRYNSLWFEATRTGVFQVFCTQYCGTNHSYMWTAVKVLEPDAYQAWLKKAANPAAGKSPAEYGALLYHQKGCSACHHVDGSAGIGPTWKGIWGTTVAFEGGRSKVVDAAYVKLSMMDPTADIVKGFQPVMPPYKGILSDEEIAALTAYIKSLK